MSHAYYMHLPCISFHIGHTSRCSKVILPSFNLLFNCSLDEFSFLTVVRALLNKFCKLNQDNYNFNNFPYCIIHCKYCCNQRIIQKYNVNIIPDDLKMKDYMKFLDVVLLVELWNAYVRKMQMVCNNMAFYLQSRLCFSYFSC